MKIFTVICHQKFKARDFLSNKEFEMENPQNPVEPNQEPQRPVPNVPDEGQSVQPNRPDTEINPGRPGNDTEVDLDKSKIKTYPPERH